MAENLFDDELIEKAKEAKSAEELIAMAKEKGVELTKEQAEEYFAQLNPASGEMSDDELGAVAGGGCGSDNRLFPVGSLVEFCTTSGIPVGDARQLAFCDRVPGLVLCSACCSHYDEDSQKIYYGCYQFVVRAAPSGGKIDIACKACGHLKTGINTKLVKMV